MISYLFNGADLLLCIIAISAAYMGSRYDRKRNQRKRDQI